MKRYLFAITGCALLACCASPLYGQQGTTAAQDKTTRIFNVLETKQQLNFADAPLSDVVEFLSSALSIPIYVDKRALTDIGLDLDMPISFRASNMTVRSSLNHILDAQDLTWLVRDDLLQITSTMEAEARTQLRVFPVADLVADASGRQSSYDYDSLIETIVTSIAPDMWDDVGGPGSVEPLYGSLLVTQTRTVNEQIEQFLAAYRAVRDHYQQKPKEVLPFLVMGDARNASVIAALGKPVTLEFQDAPLNEVVEFLSQTIGVPVLIDERALEDVGLGTDAPISCDLTDKKLESAVSLVLGELELTYAIRDEALVVTTPEEAEGRLNTVFYPVPDLATVKRNPLPWDASSLDNLLGAITSTVAKETWDEVGGPGSIDVLTNPPTLVVSQTPDVHAQLVKLMEKLRWAKQEELRLNPAAAQEAPASPNQTRLFVYNVDQNQLGATGTTVDDLVELVRKVTGPTRWQGNEQYLLEAYSNRIVVRHNDAMHTEVQQLLKQLRVWSPFSGGGFGGGSGGFGGGGLGGGTGGSGGFFDMPDRR